MRKEIKVRNVQGKKKGERNPRWVQSKPAKRGRFVPAKVGQVKTGGETSVGTIMYQPEFTYKF